MKEFIISILIAAAVILGAVFCLGRATDSYLATHPEVAKQAQTAAESEKAEVAAGKFYRASAVTETQRGVQHASAKISSRFH